MANTDLLVIQKAKALALHSFKITSNINHYPKKYRHSLVDRIQIRSLDIYDALREANNISNKTHCAERCKEITKSISYCEHLMFYIELSMNIHLISAESAQHWTSMVKDIKYMSLAWRTSELSKLI